MANTTQNSSPEFDCRSEAVTRWLDTLPRGSVGRTAEMLYVALQSIQRQDLKPGDRFRTLEALRENIHYVTTGMKKHFTGKPYPLPEKLLLVSVACRAIYKYMADGYLAVHERMSKQKSMLVDKKMQMTAVHRAITFINQSLLTTYSVYAAYHHDYWEKLHSLYEYAEQNNLLSNLVYDNLYLARKKSSISDEYCRALLLYLSEPYHLRPGEIDTVTTNIDRWRGLARVENFEHQVDPEDIRFAVMELDRDHPPQTSKSIPIASDLKKCRYLDTDRLLETLNNELQTLIEAQGAPEHHKENKLISIGLLRRLIESWGNTRRRRYPRQQVFNKINITLGLHQTHMQLVYEQHLANASVSKDMYSGFSHKPKFESIEVKDINRENSDIWSTVYNWASENTQNTQKTEQTEQFDILDCRVRQDNWTLLNESAEGFCLMCVDKQAEKIQVGELISIQRPGQTNSRSVGVIRWMKAYGKQGVEVGGLLLAPSAIPVSLAHNDGNTADHIIDRGLLLPLMQMLNRPETLITFSRQYKMGDILTITESDKTSVNIKLLELVADNGTINQFLFERFEHSVTDVETNDSSSVENDTLRFSDVWNNI